MSIQTSSSRRSLLYFSTLALSVAACSGGGGGVAPFTLGTAEGSVTADASMIVRGSMGVYFADEMVSTGPGFPGNLDLNLDGDSLDKVARVVQISSRTDTSTGAAAESAEILGSDIFLEVLEADDGRDWNGDLATTGRVLLHFDRSTETLTFVDNLNPASMGPALLVAGDRLYYSADPMALLGDETSLRTIAMGVPLTPNAIVNTTGDGTLSPSLLGEDQGLIFMALDENVEGRDLNGDADMTDAFVLALLDGTAASAPVKNTSLAMLDGNQPFDAEPTGVSDWTLAFLVDEAAQGALSLNDESTFADPINVASCVGMDDADAMDQVLHFIEFDTFMSGMSTPVNTGLAGSGRVIALSGAVATLSPEADGGCDLNEDGDMGDTIARWTSTVLPLMPPVNVVEMHAIATGIAGDSMGLSRLDNRLIGIISEAGDQQDLDMRVPENDLVAWLDPTLGAASTWTFRHQSGSNSNIGTGIFEDTNADGIGDPFVGASEPYAGADWMAAEETFGRLGITFQESVPGSNPLVPSLNTNLLCGFVQKDMDLGDSLPVWLDFEGSILDFDGLGFASDPMNAGVTTNQSVAFFVVSEMFDNTDYNGDADFSDTLLFRNPTTQCSPVLMSTLRGGATSVMGPLLYTDGASGAMFLVDEAAQGMDLNGDSDAIDFVVQYFRF